MPKWENYVPAGPGPGRPGNQNLEAAAELLDGADQLLADVEAFGKGLTLPTGQEVRVVDPTTGGAKGSKLARFDLVPWAIVREVAEHFGRGSRKYDDRNWEKGYAWSLSFAALHRHLESFWNGDDIDDDPSLYEDGEPHTARHIIAVVWHALVLAFFSRFNVGTDDRPNSAR